MRPEDQIGGAYSYNVYSLLVEIHFHGIYAQGFADDVSIIGVGRFFDTVSGIV